MGQTIDILETTVIGDALVVDTDRSLAGQDGEGFSRDVTGDATFPARLAARLFEGDAGIDHVFVMSNTVTIRREGGWDSAAEDAARSVVSRFFRFYE